MEMTELVREGILSVDEVLRRTNETMDSQIIEEFKFLADVNRERNH